MSRAVVVGAGLSGLVAAVLLRRGGHEVTLVTRGLGGLQLSQGTVDVLGRTARGQVDDPYAAMDDLPATHPYRMIGAPAVRQGVSLLAELVGPDLLEPPSTIPHNALLPTAVGAWRPTRLVPPSMAAGRRAGHQPTVIVGVDQVKDFHPALVAGNLSRSPLPGGERPSVRATSVSFEARAGEVDTPPMALARALDRPEVREVFAQAVRGVVDPGELVGLPAVLGLDDPQAWRDLQDRIGHPLFEIPLQPPSVPGMRLNQALVTLVKAERVRWMLGAEVVGLESKEAESSARTDDRHGRTVTGVRVRTAGGTRVLPADVVVHAPGGFESGALAVDSFNRVSETVFGLPVTASDATALIHGRYWEPQPLFEVGLRVDEQMRVLDEQGHPVYRNLHACGSVLAGSIRWHEKSGEGIALGSAVRAVESIGGLPGRGGTSHQEEQS